MIKWHELFFQGVKQIWNNICVISLKTYPKKCKKPRSLTVKSLTSFYGWSCCKIQRNNFTHQRNNYFDSTNYLYIRRIIYISNEIIISIQQILLNEWIEVFLFNQIVIKYMVNKIWTWKMKSGLYFVWIYKRSRTKTHIAQAECW